MSDGFKFADLIKPGEAGRLALIREMELRRERWSRPGYHYRGAGDFLLQHGRYYAPPPVFPDDVEENAHGTCFINALEYATATGLRYCEGLYAVAKGFLAHAWCLTPDDRPIELTMPRDPERYTTTEGAPFLPVERWAYWGVVFPVEFIRWHSETYLAANGNPSFCVLDRSPFEIEQSRRLAGWGMVEDGAFEDSHDLPLLKQPFYPRMTSL